MTSDTTTPTGRRSRARSCPSCAGLSRDGHLCHKCTRITKKTLTRIAGLWPSLQETITRRDRLQPPSEVRGSTVFGPLPFRSDASEVADQVRRDLLRWAQVCVRTHGAPTPLELVPAMCGLLIRFAGHLRKGPGSAAWASDVAGCLKSIMRAIDLTDRRAPAGPCPERTEDGEPCPGVIVATYPVDESVRPHMDCTRPTGVKSVCGRSWLPEEWDGLGRRIVARQAQVDQQKARAKPAGDLRILDLNPPDWIGGRSLLTVQDASVVCGIPQSTLYRWLKEGRLRTYEIPASIGGPRRLKVVDPGEAHRQRAREVDELDGIDMETRRARVLDSSENRS